MPIEIVMPQMGWSAETGSLVEWLKNDGDAVAAGDLICRIQSDKAVNDVESEDSGILRIPPDSPPAGVDVPVGTVLAYLTQPGETIAFGSPVVPTPPAAQQRAEAVSRREPVAAARPTAEPAAPPAGQPRAPTLRWIAPPARAAELRKEQLLTLYRKMLEIRRCEEAIARAHHTGLISGACHTYVGEEAVATGVCAHLRQDDFVFSTHRGHGHALAKGVTPRELVAELFGRTTGVSHGRGGSMHLFSPDVGMLGTSGIVGPSILMATGVGYTFKLLKTDRVGVAFFGDGASNNGAFHEGLNLASIWKLPVVFVCENNLYATEISLASVAANPNIADKAVGYGLPGLRIDGNDVFAVYDAAGEAVRRARAGEGPTLLECATYRTRPHGEGMRDFGYRTREEVDEWKARCPIKRLRDWLIGNGLASADEIEGVDQKVQATAEDAVEFAKNSPWPDPATATSHIFSTP